MTLETERARVAFEMLMAHLHEVGEDFLFHIEGGGGPTGFFRFIGELGAVASNHQTLAGFNAEREARRSARGK